MSRPQPIQLESLAALRAQSAAWDDLWQCSAMSAPTGRAELVARWVEHFAPRAEFRALVVEQGGTWCAALPLVGARLGRMLRVGQLPSNTWLPGPSLLLDPACDVPRALDALVDGMRRLPWDVLWLDHAPLDASAWAALTSALRRTGIPFSSLRRQQVARLDVDHDWPAFARRLPGHLLREVRRSSRRLREQGQVGLRVQTQFAPETLEACLRRSFEVEHRSWKGRAGTSVMAAGMLGFFVGQSELLARWGNLHLATLECRGWPVAFSYGLLAKGVYHGCKTGYDAAFARFGPGQLLVHELLEHLWQDPAVRAFDFVGQLTAAEQRWQPNTYSLGRLVVGLRGTLGRWAVSAHQRFWPRLRLWRQTLRSPRNANQRQGALHE